MELDVFAEEQDTVTTAEKDELSRRIANVTDGKGFDRWMHNDEILRGYDHATVRHHCVQNAEWQQCRLSMKGINTHEKLAICKKWWDDHGGGDVFSTEVQIGNYLGALRRGGQLDANNRVRKWR